MNYGKNRETGESTSTDRLNAVICGSFRRDPAALQSEFLELRESGCTVLSPVDLDFVGEVEGFVYGKRDLGRSSAEIEQFHLHSMKKADLVWLHCPGGYVGTSASMELGFAQALGIRVFSAEKPDDVVLADLVLECDSPSAAVTTLKQGLSEAPAHALLALQTYYMRVAEERGWSNETAALTLELLKGEIKELEAAVRREADDDSSALELADVQLYVVHLANILGVDLDSAVRAKERINSERFEVSTTRFAA